MAFNVSLATGRLMVLEAYSDGDVADLDAIHLFSISSEGVDRLGCHYEEEKEKWV
jgi:hypothetical protein